MTKSSTPDPDDLTIWEPTRRPAKYRYLKGDPKHPYEWKACLSCGEESWIQKHRNYCSYACSKTGPLNPQWKGDEAGYLACHQRVYRERGVAVGCSTCGLDDPDAHYEWANLTGDYHDVNDYSPMCKPCHSAYDNSRRPSNGRWVYTDDALDKAEEMRKTMTLKATAEALGLDPSNLSKELSKRRNQ